MSNTNTEQVQPITDDQIITVTAKIHRVQNLDPVEVETAWLALGARMRAAEAEVADLRSRLACCSEATYWDRPYDERMDAIRGMCDLTTNGLTPQPPHPDGPAGKELEQLRAWKAKAMEVMAGLQDLGRALGLPLGARITGPAAVEAARRLREETEEARTHAAAITAIHNDWRAALADREGGR